MYSLYVYTHMYTYTYKYILHPPSPEMIITHRLEGYHAFTVTSEVESEYNLV